MSVNHNTYVPTIGNLGYVTQVQLNEQLLPYATSVSVASAYVAKNSISMAAGTGSFTNIVSTNAKFTSMTGTTGAFIGLTCGTGTFTNITNTYESVTSLTGTAGAFTNITNTYESVTSLTGTAGAFTNIINSYETVTSLTGTAGAFSNLTCVTGSFGNILYSGSVSATATAGAITLPIAAVGFFPITIGLTGYKLPYYNL